MSVGVIDIGSPGKDKIGWAIVNAMGREHCTGTDLDEGVCALAGARADASRLRAVLDGSRSFALDLDAARREAANDDAPEHRVGVGLTARW